MSVSAGIDVFTEWHLESMETVLHDPTGIIQTVSCMTNSLCHAIQVPEGGIHDHAAARPQRHHPRGHKDAQLCRVGAVFHCHVCGFHAVLAPHAPGLFSLLDCLEHQVSQSVTQKLFV